MLILSEVTLDTWRSDAEEFQRDLLSHSYMLSKAVGLYFNFDQSELRRAHLDWVGNCASWEAQHRASGSNGLSHLKILALLLQALSIVPWVKEDSVVEYTQTDRDYEFRGSSEHRDQVNQDIVDGEGTYLGFQFVTYALNWFESKRIDRLGPFEYRMTKALEHDFMVYLTDMQPTTSAVYLILKALYARHPNPELAH